MQQESREFHDPTLKAALKRALESEAAPPALRQRIVQSACQEPQPTLISLWRHPAFRVAASLLLGLIGVYAVLAQRSPKASVPQAVVASMVARHDGCAGGHDHRQPGIPQDDFRLMGESLAARLKIRVLAADLRGDGWTFRGAALCPVNGAKTAHLLFADADRALSLFSVPPAAAPGATDGGIVSHTVLQRPVAVFAQGGVVYAAVGQGNITPADVRQLLAKHRNDIVAAAVALGIAPSHPAAR